MSNGASVGSIGTVLMSASEEIARRWLERISARVAVERNFVFPSEDLIDGIPLLVEGIANQMLRGPDNVAADVTVVMKARELGRLRHSQRFSARQVLWEYELLGLIILQFLDEQCEAGTIMDVPRHEYRTLHQSLATIQRATVEEYLAGNEEQIKEREDRLRAFNRALTHELRNDVGVVLGAARMLREDFVLDDREHAEKFVSIVINNSERLEIVVQNLLELARIDFDGRQNRNVLLQHSAEEVMRRLRSLADTSGVRLVSAPLPDVEVHAAALDFCLTNLIVNGIKYHQPECKDRWVRIQASLVAKPDLDYVLVEVIDNGRSVPEDDRPNLFERHFRAGNAMSEPGTGLGLSLVREFINRLGGQVWAEFTEGETVFAFTMPARRAEDQGNPH